MFVIPQYNKWAIIAFSVFQVREASTVIHNDFGGWFKFMQSSDQFFNAHRVWFFHPLSPCDVLHAQAEDLGEGCFHGITC